MEQKGLYLYAIRPPAGFFPEIKSIDNSHYVFTLLVGGEIEAVVSQVSLKEFGAEKIFQKAQNDLQWIKEKSLIHNRVITESAEGTDGAIVPMKFGSIFKNKENLSKTIKKDSKKFHHLFKKLKGKEEWSAKVFVNPENMKEEIIMNDREIQKIQKKIASLPDGIAYFKEKELEDELERKKISEFQKWAQKIFKKLEQFADETKIGKILEKGLTQRKEAMILNPIFLINKKKLKKFQGEAEKLRKSLESKGLLIEVSGPWPPYSFV